MSQVWVEVQTSLRDRIEKNDWDIWIRPLTYKRADAQALVLAVPNRYFGDWVRETYLSVIQEEVARIAGASLDIRFEVHKTEPERDDPPPQPPTPSPGPHQATDSGHEGLATDMTFDNFVVGACNQLAHAASQAAAENPGDPDYNPLFIYGSTGLGKTHLMHAIGNRILESRPDARLVYINAEQFTNEYIQAVRYKKFDEFRRRYRTGPHVLLIDDIQFIGGRERTQEELFHTFEELRKLGKQIVFAADVLPREIEGLEPRLRTRCESGMIADMQPPDLETMVAILHQKSDDLGMQIPLDLAQYIAARVRLSVREIQGVLRRLNLLCRLHNEPPSLAFARTHLASVLAEEPRAPTAQEIIETVASFYNIKVTDLMGTRRLKQLVRPRHVAMYLVRDLTEFSFPEIGRSFHRDHATIQHACKKIAVARERDADMRNAIDAIRRNLGR